jgi:membrane protein, antimicrobial resistance system
MSELMDLLRVLWEPGAVFERVREKPSFWWPFLGLCAVQIVIGILQLPFTKAMMQARMATAPAGAPDPSKFAAIGLIFVPIGVGIALLIIGVVLWVLTSIFSGEAKFGTIMSVAAYSAVPSIVLLGLASMGVLLMKGVAAVSSPADMQPSVGSLLMVLPDAKGFLGGILRGLNIFAIWGSIITAIGISTTHKTSKGTGYAVAFTALAIGLIVGGAFAAMFAGRMGG